MVTNQKTALPMTAANQRASFTGAAEDARSRRGRVWPLLVTEYRGENQSEASINDMWANQKLSIDI